MKSARRIIVASSALIGILAIASFVTTAGFWDGGFPSGEFRLTIKNANGQPIHGAVFHVFRGGTRELSFGYPFENHVAGRDIASDVGGQLTLIQPRSGLQFGGFSWKLFWLIEMGAKVPKYDCEIIAPGYQAVEISVRQIVQAPPLMTTDSEIATTRIIRDGQPVELKIHERTITLEK
jgi:hypothetical protein